MREVPVKKPDAFPLRQDDVRIVELPLVRDVIRDERKTREPVQAPARPVREPYAYD